MLATWSGPFSRRFAAHPGARWIELSLVESLVMSSLTCHICYTDSRCPAFLIPACEHHQKNVRPCVCTCDAEVMSATVSVLNASTNKRSSTCSVMHYCLLLTWTQVKLTCLFLSLGACPAAGDVLVALPQHNHGWRGSCGRTQQCCRVRRRGCASHAPSGARLPFWKCDRAAARAGHDQPPDRVRMAGVAPLG